MWASTQALSSVQSLNLLKLKMDNREVQSFNENEATTRENVGSKDKFPWSRDGFNWRFATHWNQM